MSDQSIPPLRSQSWFTSESPSGFVARSWTKNQGYPNHLYDGRPVIGIEAGRVDDRVDLDVLVRRGHHEVVAARRAQRAVAVLPQAQDDGKNEVNFVLHDVGHGTHRQQG